MALLMLIAVSMLTGFLLFWAIVLIFVSFEAEDPNVFWFQRLLALLILSGVMGVVLMP